MKLHTVLRVHRLLRVKHLAYTLYLVQKLIYHMSGGDWKAMFKAVQDGDLELVRYYLQMGINPNYQHPEFMAAPLVESIRFGQLTITRLLLENGADPKIQEVLGGATPLSVASMKKNQKAIVLIEEFL